MCLEVVFQNMPDMNCDDLQSCPLPKRNQKFETPLAMWAEQGPDGSTLLSPCRVSHRNGTHNQYHETLSPQLTVQFFYWINYYDLSLLRFKQLKRNDNNLIRSQLVVLVINHACELKRKIMLKLVVNIIIP